MTIAGTYSEDKRSFIDSVSTQQLNLSLRTAINAAERVRYRFNELLIVLTRSGGIRYSTDGSETRICHQPGQILVVPAGVPVYTDYLAPTTRAPLQCVTLEIGSELLCTEDQLERCSWPDSEYYGALYSLDDISEFMRGEAAAAIGRIDSLTRAPVQQACREQLIELSSREILVYVRQSAACAALAGGTRLRSGSRLEALHQFIAGHLADDLSTAALARHCHLSRAQFHKKFVDTFGITPQAHVQSARLTAARQLLETEHDTPVAAIAARTGFRSPAHFSTAFRAQTGLAPSAYRARRRRH